MIKFKMNKHGTRSNKIIIMLGCVLVLSMLFISCTKPKIYKVGILAGAPPFYAIADGFKAKMTELGYTEGKNIIYDIQKSKGDPNEWKQMAEKFVADKVDLIFSFPTDPAIFSRNAAKDSKIPVVFAMTGIEGNDLVKGVKEPGGNITGVRDQGPDNVAKRLEMLVQISPKIKTIYLTYNPGYPTVKPALDVLKPAAEKMGITFIESPVKSPADIQADLDKRDKQKDIGFDAILIIPEPLTQSPDSFPIIVKFANAHKIPIGGALHHTAALGALFSYIPDNVNMGQLAAVSADKVLKGTAAGTIPVVSPESVLKINYKAAQAIGITINDTLLGMANEIIK